MKWLKKLYNKVKTMARKIKQAPRRLLQKLVKPFNQQRTRRKCQKTASKLAKAKVKLVIEEGRCANEAFNQLIEEYGKVAEGPELDSHVRALKRQLRPLVKKAAWRGHKRAQRYLVQHYNSLSTPTASQVKHWCAILERKDHQINPPGVNTGDMSRQLAANSTIRKVPVKQRGSINADEKTRLDYDNAANVSGHSLPEDIFIDLKQSLQCEYIPPCGSPALR